MRADRFAYREESESPRKFPTPNKITLHAADQENVRGGSRISRRRGHQHTNLPDFPKNCMKLRKFWSV